MMMTRFLKTFSETFLNELAWFIISTVLLVILLPKYIDWRQYRNQKTIRRMIASRISRMHQSLKSYILSSRRDLKNPQDPEERQQALVDLKNAVHHLMAVPNHFTSALGGKIGGAYFNYRVISTNVSATIALALGDYDKFFSDIFFTHATIPTSSIGSLNTAYGVALSELGSDIHSVEAMQPVLPAWSSDDVIDLEIRYAALHRDHGFETPSVEITE